MGYIYLKKRERKHIIQRFSLEQKNLKCSTSKNKQFPVNLQTNDIILRAWTSLWMSFCNHSNSRYNRDNTIYLESFNPFQNQYSHRLQLQHELSEFSNYQVIFLKG